MNKRTSVSQVHLDGDRLVERTIPLASRLPLYPAVQAALEAVEQILMRDFRSTSEEARERIRVEITRDVEMELRALVSNTNYHLAHDPLGTEGPMQIMGVCFYVVDRLPDPGWRVRGAPR